MATTCAVMLRQCLILVRMVCCNMHEAVVLSSQRRQCDIAKLAYACRYVPNPKPKPQQGGFGGGGGDGGFGGGGKGNFGGSKGGEEFLMMSTVASY